MLLSDEKPPYHSPHCLPLPTSDDILKESARRRRPEVTVCRGKSCLAGIDKTDKSALLDIIWIAKVLWSCFPLFTIKLIHDTLRTIGTKGGVLPRLESLCLLAAPLLVLACTTFSWFYCRWGRETVLSVTGGGFISARKIIAIHRPLGADLQPLIFRIPRVFFFFFAFFFYLQPCLRRGGERGQVGWWRMGWAKPPLRAI